MHPKFSHDLPNLALFYGRYICNIADQQTISVHFTSLICNGSRCVEYPVGGTVCLLLNISHFKNDIKMRIYAS